MLRSSWLINSDSFRWMANGLSLTYICIHLPQTPLPSRLPHNIEQSSTCYSSTVSPCWLSVFNTARYTCRLPWWLSSKEFACSVGDTGDVGPIPGGIFWKSTIWSFRWSCVVGNILFSCISWKSDVLGNRRSQKWQNSVPRAFNPRSVGRRVDLTICWLIKSGTQPKLPIKIPKLPIKCSFLNIYLYAG